MKTPEQHHCHSVLSKLLPGLVGGLMLSSNNPFDLHDIIVSVSPVGILKVLKSS